ncbi:MAG: DNA polymerase IV [Oscillospiraceae bacterium]
MKERYILHCDCNSFFASVELLSHPELKDLPVAVGGDAQSRHGIVLAKNEAAKKFGIKTAETLWQAKNKCPDLIILPPHHDLYTKYSHILNDIYNQYTDLVEPFGIDESWLDVTNSYKLFAPSAQKLADDLRLRVRLETGLTISVGVSFNKIFAKLGSDYKKPDATTLISLENYKEIVFPLPVEEMIYVGKTTKNALNSMGIFTIGELAKQTLESLEGRFGKHGVELYRYANGLEDSPVEPFEKEKEFKSVGSGNTFSRNLVGLDDVKPALMSLAEDVGQRLRKYEVYAGGIQITIRDPSFYTFTRQCKVDNTNVSQEIYLTALKLLTANWNMKKEIRALTITAIDIQKEDRQLQQVSLFDPPSDHKHEKNEKLQKAIDKIRGKYGASSVQNATIMASDVTKTPKVNPFGEK